eukprot:SAG11_NODE_5823_length_1456_cov_0.831245_2_plen_147_part_00
MVTQENPLKPWARHREEARRQAEKVQGGWRKGKGAFTFGKRTAEDNALAQTVALIKYELGIEDHHAEGGAPLAVAKAAARSVIPHEQTASEPTRAHAIAAVRTRCPNTLQRLPSRLYRRMPHAVACLRYFHHASFDHRRSAPPRAF